MSTEAKTKRAQQAARAAARSDAELAMLSTEAEAKVCGLRAWLSEAEAHARVIRDEVARRSSKIQIGDVVQDGSRHSSILWVVVRVGAARKAPYGPAATVRRIALGNKTYLLDYQMVSVDPHPTGKRWKGKLRYGSPGEVVDV